MHFLYVHDNPSFYCEDGWQESEWLILPLLLIANENCSQLSAVTLLWQGLSLRDTQILLDTVLQTEPAEINEKSLKGFDSSWFYQCFSLKAKYIFYYFLGFDNVKNVETEYADNLIKVCL